MIPKFLYGAPSYDLKVDGIVAGPIFKDRLLSLSVTHHGGKYNDQLSMTFDDRPTKMGFGKAMALPKQGKQIEVLMGYELRLVSMGTFQVNQVSLGGSTSGRTLSVTGVPRLLLNELTRTWAKTTIGDIVKTIADEHALEAKISSLLRGTAIDRENQVRESDLSFLTRLAEKYDGVVKPAAGRLLFLKKGESVTASGISLEAVSLTPSDITQWSYSVSEQVRYEAVIAVWHDLEQAVQHQVSVGNKSSDEAFRMPHLYASEAEAKAAAEAKLNEFKRDTATLSLTTIGNSELTAEGTIKVKGLRNDVDGKWVVQNVTHMFSSDGYQCSLSAYKQ